MTGGVAGDTEKPRHRPLWSGQLESAVDGEDLSGEPGRGRAGQAENPMPRLRRARRGDPGLLGAVLQAAGSEGVGQ